MYWKIYCAFGLIFKKKKYEHQPEAVFANDSHKVLWNFSVKMFHIVEVRRPSPIVIDNEIKKVRIHDILLLYKNGGPKKLKILSICNNLPA